MGELKQINAELSLNHVLVTMEKSTKSNIITNVNGKDHALKDVQTVVKTGPFIKRENGMSFEVGDRVVLDTRKLLAKNSLVLMMSFNKETGNYVNINSPEYKESECDSYFLITDREILMKLT
jgi:hypothetical protein